MIAVDPAWLQVIWMTLWVVHHLQEMGKLMTEVVWPVDRLAKELAGVGKEIARLENQMRMTGSTRTVGDVDMDLEKLEVGVFPSERWSYEDLCFVSLWIAWRPRMSGSPPHSQCYERGPRFG